MDVSRIPQEARRRILEEAWKQGLKPRDLGVSYSFMYKMRNGLKPVPDWVVRKILELKIVDDDVLASLGIVPRFDNVRTWSMERMLEVIIEWAEANPASARVLVQTLDAELRKRGITGPVVYVSDSMLREWEDYLAARVATGSLSVKQARDHRNYLRRLLGATGRVIAPDPVRRAILEEARRSPKAAQKMNEAVRLFVREIVGDKELWEQLPRFRAGHSEARAPSWNEICAVLGEAEWPPARAILLLAFSGLRIETIYTLKVYEVDFEARVLSPMRDRGKKRDWFSFIPIGAAEWLASEYMLWREIWLRTGVKGQERMKDRVVPVKPRRIRLYLYSIMDRVLGYRFQLGKIRHRVTTQLSMYLPSLWVEILTGHAPKRIVQEHYLQRDVMEQMRAKYDEAMASVPCLSDG